VHDSGRAGLGHRRRMEALEQGFRRRGFDTAVSVMADQVRAPVVVVDSYDRRADEAWVEADVVVAVDDLDRDLAVDVLVDPSPGSRREPHRRAGVVLAGAEFALLGPGLPPAARPAAAVVERVVVTLGGHDPEGLAFAVARELARLRPDVVVASTGGPTDEGRRGVVEALATTSGLGSALAAADLVVCAGGVTLLESLVLERPTVVVTVAANQRRSAEAVVLAGAAVAATPTTAAVAASSLIDDPERRAALAGRAGALVDREGPDRVAAAVAERLDGAGR
jgi:UDP-2,4-diacetamido-2,4,6-trideoxy-beta-L-altropyranose hydrolase